MQEHDMITVTALKWVPPFAAGNEIVDFDRLNDTRLHKVAVAATRVRDGVGVSFASTGIRLDARHVMASGSLPPASR